MKIVLCHIASTNLGDVVIHDCTRFILDRVLSECGIQDFTIEEVNIGKQPPVPSRPRLPLWRRAFLKIAKWTFPMSAIRLKWKWSPTGQAFVQREQAKFQGADAVIFDGGGIVKFRQERFFLYVDEIMRWADRARIPVLFNAVGVEGYDARDARCRLLKCALNRRTVKMLTTRDDAETLRRFYCPRSRLDIHQVADPAFWTPEAFGVSHAPNTTDPTIGLNVIRPEIFGEYLDPVDKAALIRLYCRLAHRLLDAGHRVEFFSNGGRQDGAFIDDLLRSDASLADDRRLSAFRPANARELVERIAGYGRFLAVRLHAAIIGTSLGIPNVSLVWNRKQAFFGDAVGLKGNFLGKDDFREDVILSRLMNATGWKTNEPFRNTTLEALRHALRSIASSSIQIDNADRRSTFVIRCVSSQQDGLGA